MILKALSSQLVTLVFDYAQQKCEDEADFILFKSKADSDEYTNEAQLLTNTEKIF